MEFAGRPRRDPETADEYRPSLASLLAAPQEVPVAIATITDTYRRTRYSGLPATEQEAVTVLAAWQVIERAGS